jgi:NitT/TauT family transport system permease protein
MILILIWELVYKIGAENLKLVKANDFPDPYNVLKTLTALIKDNTLIIAVATSLIRLLIGYIIALVLGIVIGISIISFKFLDDNLSPLILGLQTLPNVCWIPLATLWFGLNEKAIIFVVAIGSVFAIAIATGSGIKNVNPIYSKAAKTMGAKGLTLYKEVIIPAALPAIASGMKQGWSFAWRGLISGEMLLSSKGLGQILMSGRNLSDINKEMAVMVVIVVLGLLFDKLIFERLDRGARYLFN